MRVDRRRAGQQPDGCEPSREGERDLHDVFCVVSEGAMISNNDSPASTNCSRSIKQRAFAVVLDSYRKDSRSCGMSSKAVNGEGIGKKIDMEMCILLNSTPNDQREQ